MKAQVHQVFIYILTILVVGMILIIGVKFFGSINNSRCDADQSLFRQDFENLLRRYSPYDSYAPLTITLPCGMDTLCVVDANAVNQSKADGTPCVPNKFTTGWTGLDISRFYDVPPLGQIEATLTNEGLNRSTLIFQSVFSCARQNLFLAKTKSIGSGNTEGMVFNEVVPFGYFDRIRLAYCKDINDKAGMPGVCGTAWGNELWPGDRQRELCVRGENGRVKIALRGRGSTTRVELVKNS